MDRDLIIKKFISRISKEESVGSRTMTLPISDAIDIKNCLIELMSEYFSNTVEEVKNMSKKPQSDDEVFELSGGSF